MNSNTKFYIKLGIVVPVIIFAIIIIIASYATKGKERRERSVRRSQERVFGVEEVTIFDTETGVDNGLLSGLPEDKAEEYSDILLKDDFIDMTIILYSADGAPVWRKEVQNAYITGGMGDYMLYEKDPVTVLKRTMIDVGGGQLVIIEK